MSYAITPFKVKIFTVVAKLKALAWTPYEMGSWSYIHTYGAAVAQSVEIGGWAVQVQLQTTIWTGSSYSLTTRCPWARHQTPHVLPGRCPSLQCVYLYILAIYMQLGQMQRIISPLGLIKYRKKMCIKGGHNVFSHKVWISGLLEIWITLDKLYSHFIFVCFWCFSYFKTEKCLARQNFSQISINFGVHNDCILSFWWTYILTPNMNNVIANNRAFLGQNHDTEICMKKESLENSVSKSIPSSCNCLHIW